MMEIMSRTKGAASIREPERSQLAARVVADYQAGYTMEQAAARSDISFTLAQRLIVESGVQRRTPAESRAMSPQS